MAAWSEMGVGARVGVAAAGCAVLVAIGFALWPAPPVPVPVAAVAPLAAPEPAVAAPEPAVVAQPVAPSFDTWRVDADGAAVVSGRAGPGAVVSVLVDGAVVATATATDRGEFVALFTLPPNPAPSLMTLSALLPDGTVVVAAQTVALGAIAGPVVAAVAEASPEPAAAPPVPADPPPAILLTDAGVQVTPAPMDGRVTLDAIAYTPAGDVQLSGTGQPGQGVRLYLDTALVASVPVAPGGQWSVTLTDTPPGLYTLRVDQVDEAGRVTARMETPFQRETRQALAALLPPPAAPAVPAAPQPAVVAAPAAPPPATTTPAAPVQPAAATLPQVGTPPAAVPDAVPVPAIAPPQISDATPPAPAPVQTAAAPDAPAPDAAPVPVASVAPLPAQGAADPAPASPPTVSITVQPGFTLWGIARQQLGEGVLYVQVFEANKGSIRNPDLIYPGQVFILPTR